MYDWFILSTLLIFHFYIASKAESDTKVKEVEEGKNKDETAPIKPSELKENTTETDNQVYLIL